MFEPRHSPVLCEIFGHAAAAPDKVALVGGARRVTYARLASGITEAACLLQEMGLKRGDRIVLMAHKEVEFVYLYFAAHLLGVVNVVVDPVAPADRLRYIEDTIEAGAVFDSSALRRLDLARFDGFSPELPRVAADDVADVMFTTGTTGRPKGVCLTHANVAGSAANINGFIGTSADDVEALGLPLSHSFGLGRLRCVLMAGGTMVLMGSFANLKAFFTAIEEEHVTGFGMVPAVWQYIKRLSGRRIAKYSAQLRYIEVGSAALPLEDKRLLMEMFPTTRLCVHYGLTEASRALFAELHASADDLETIGRPASPLVEACVIDEQGHEVTDGIDGELCVRGNMVCRSYFLPGDNEGVFSGGWFRTGDWGHRAANGKFYLTGRKKEMINVGGEKVSPAAIECAIKSLGVTDCACVAIADPAGMLGEVPKAFVVQGDSQLSFDDIKARLAGLLPPHEIPVQWEWIDAIPRSASGKIQRLKLKQ